MAGGSTRGTGTGSTNSVVAAASTEGPGLYEVYQVPVHAASETSEEQCQARHGHD